jgi:ribosome-associated protein
MSISLQVRGEYIQLDQLLKTTGLCPSGGRAPAELEVRNVRVGRVVVNRQPANLRPGQQVDYAGETVLLVS